MNNFANFPTHLLCVRGRGFSEGRFRLLGVMSVVAAFPGSRLRPPRP